MSRPSITGPSYSARNHPLRPEATWTIEDRMYFWEMRGDRGSRREIASLLSLKVVGDPGTPRRSAILDFGSKGRPRRVIIPAQSLTGGMLLEDRSAAFDVFIAELRKVWGGQGKIPLSRREHRNAQIVGRLMWAICLTAAGALFMIFAALLSGMPSLGLALGARLLFVAVLLAAALPWLGRDRGL